MGVNHARDSGNKSPRIWSGGTLMQTVPRFCHIGTKISVLWPSKYAKIRFRPGLCPGPRWGSSRRSSRLLSRLEKGTPLPISHSTRHGATFGARHASPQKSSQIYAYAHYLASRLLNSINKILKDWRGELWFQQNDTHGNSEEHKRKHKYLQNIHILRYTRRDRRWDFQKMKLMFVTRVILWFRTAIHIWKCSVYYVDKIFVLNVIKIK